MDYFPASAGDQDALASVGQHRCVYSLLMCFLPPPDSCCSLHQRIALDDGRDCKTVNKLLPPHPTPPKHMSWAFWVFRLLSGFCWHVRCLWVHVWLWQGERIHLVQLSGLCVHSLQEKKRASKEETHTRCEGKGSADSWLFARISCNGSLHQKKL